MRATIENILFAAGKTDLKQIGLKDLENIGIDLTAEFLFLTQKIEKDIQVERTNIRYTLFRFKGYYFEVEKQNGIFQRIGRSKDIPFNFEGQKELQRIIKY